MPGAIHETRFDNWYAGFTDWAGVFRNEISFFTETALYRYATPRFYTVDEFPKEYQDLRALAMYTTPWEGGWWRLKDAVDYMVGASMSVLDLAAKNRESLNYNRYQAARDSIHRAEPPFAYVISSRQADVPEAGSLAQLMIENGLDVYQTKPGFKANGIDYPAGFLGRPHGPAVCRHGQGTLRASRSTPRPQPGRPPPAHICPTTLPAGRSPCRWA